MAWRSFGSTRGLSDHPVTTSLPPDLPLVSVDDILLEQVFINLLENAAKYTPAGSPIEISATLRDGEVDGQRRRPRAGHSAGG